jgi:hypothetical protein
VLVETGRESVGVGVLWSFSFFFPPPPEGETAGEVEETVDDVEEDLEETVDDVESTGGVEEGLASFPSSVTVI